MAKQVLSIGNCSYDFSTISAALEKNFSVEMHAVDDAAAAVQVTKTQKFDLIVVNRLFDLNQDSGIDLIKKLRDAQVQSPMMLISNYPEYQQEAVAAGAVAGFGKQNVGKPEMLEAVGNYLR